MQALLNSPLAKAKAIMAQGFRPLPSPCPFQPPLILPSSTRMLLLATASSTFTALVRRVLRPASQPCHAWRLVLLHCTALYISLTPSKRNLHRPLAWKAIRRQIVKMFHNRAVCRRNVQGTACNAGVPSLAPHRSSPPPLPPLCHSPSPHSQLILASRV